MTAATCLICARATGQPALRLTGHDGDTIAPERHVRVWGDLNATEQMSMLSLISAAFQEGAPVLRPGEIDGHFVLRLEDNPRSRAGDALTAIKGAARTTACLPRKPWSKRRSWRCRFGP